MNQAKEDGGTVTPYATASWPSRGTWAWIYPLVQRGRGRQMQVSDVPMLSPSDGPEVTHQKFMEKWPAGSSVRRALLRSFWPLFSINALLALLRAVSLFVGPLMIQSFVKLTSTADQRCYWAGLRLVLLLLASKVAEALFSNHYSFQCSRLAIKMRGALITALYRKSLRLSCAARKKHGAGVIVNYMTVDTHQLCDMVLLVHNLWVMPLQVIVAIALLYKYLGAVPVTAALAGVMATVGFVVISARGKNRYQAPMMAQGDRRMKATAEALSYMRVIKLQAWEEHFLESIYRCRRLELGYIRRYSYYVCWNFIATWSAPMLLSALLFVTSVLSGVRLDAGLMFTATALLQILQGPMQSLPRLLNQAVQALVSLQRLDSYMTSDELDHGAVVRELPTSLSSDDGAGISIQVEGGAFTWDEAVLLRGINLEIRTGTLAMVAGVVGSGKSSLLGCILGEMRKLSGTVTVRGTTAYVAQTVWIQNGTIEQNILFMKPMHKERYKEVIRVCGLEKDLEMMEFGDQTEIGERGVKLSGGQKQRIQLARAVYQDCDVYLLDDVFSAFDAHTAREIFKECVRGALKDKTIVLVTHQVDLLHNADIIYVMKDGVVIQSGKYNELRQASSDFAALVAAHDSSKELLESMAAGPKKIEETSSSKSGIVEVESDAKRSQKMSGRQVKEEERATGHVSFSLYKQYATEARGWWAPLSLLGLSATWQGLVVASDYFLAYGISSGVKTASHLVLIYSIIAATSVLIIVARTFLIVVFGLESANGFFSEMVKRILHAPMSFFDNTPSSRVLSRASSDQKTLDLLLPFNFWMCMPILVSVVSVLIVTCLVAWPSVISTVPLLILNFWYLSYYLPASRELTRLESTTNAPVIHHFSETVHGVMAIRCFRKEDMLFQENLDRVNSSLTMNFHNMCTNMWFSLRIELIGTIFLCGTTLLMVTLPTKFINPKLVGLSLSYGLSLNSAIFLAIWTSCFVENKMVSVERIKQFTNIPSEAAWRINDCLPDPNWPTNGIISIIDLKVRYKAPNGPLVLKGISIDIHAGEKIGAVGRSGSGKSTLIQALFRIVEPSEGKIIVDGIDICTLGLHDLRSRFGIIPQEPVLFEGTIRSNIDPLEQYSDDEIWQALDSCQLKDTVASKPEKLDALVVDNGENWSMGQRQLLCLGRVMLKRSRVLFMDEATASVDSQTDAMIQKIIEEEFAESTVINIAHRIPTVMDCDRVIVIDEGLAKEFDRPASLIERPSLFGALVEEYTNQSSTDI